MTVRLRGHHLLCILTYVGKGYSERFVKNYDRVAERLDAGESVVIVDGPDDICAPLLSDEDAHCVRSGPAERDRSALRDLSEVFGRDLRAGSSVVIDKDWLQRARELFRSGMVRRACFGCEWHDLCTDVSIATRPDLRITGQD